ncbi:hypothetical protein [Paenibacillus sp. 1001270B_150601_E10]|uniref:hypothetical protein n=1 Tax=Paenibacillus sp. 1001270B_150601_E10 TaxID=2787079 RepID=UPI00189CC4E3|nr:hypothetical protein [Paenibacillus sp. 1001270B_150601_E10]
MKKKLLIFALITAFVSIPFSFTSSTVNAEKNDLSGEKMIEIRKKNNLEYSRETINLLLKEEIDSVHEKFYGIPLLPEEEARIVKRNELQTLAEELSQSLAKVSGFAGLEVQEDKIVVRMASDFNVVADARLTAAKNDLVIEKVMYSIEELENIHKKLDQEIDGAMMFVDQVKNKLTVYTPNKESVAQYLTEEELKKVDIIESEIKVEDQAYGIGRHIVNYATSRPCSVGIYGYASNGDSVAVTAGHCVNSGTTPAFYKIDSNGNISTKIGNFVKGTTNNTNADAGYIKLDNASDISTSIGSTPITQASGSHLTNTSVGTLSQNTLWSTNGTIVSSSASVPNGSGTLTDAVLTNNTNTVGGDSGSIVFTSFFNSVKNRYEYKIYGIHKGIATTGDGKQYQIYSKISNVKTALNLSGFALGN